MGELPEQTTGSRVADVSLPRSYITQRHSLHNSKVYNPQSQPEATDRLLNLRNRWERNEELTVFTTGAFDLLHLNHIGYLMHVKASAAPLYYSRTERGSWDELSNDDREDYTDWALGAQVLKLIVSIDGDKSVEAKKSNNSRWGNSTRPIYSWTSRSLMVAAQSFVNPSSEEGSSDIIPIVDAITIHGPEDFPDSGPHHSHFDMASFLQPDQWTIYGESTEIPERLPDWPSLGHMIVQSIPTEVNTGYYHDKFVGNMSTSGTVSRILEK